MVAAPVALAAPPVAAEMARTAMRAVTPAVPMAAARAVWRAARWVGWTGGQMVVATGLAMVMVMVMVMATEAMAMAAPVVVVVGRWWA